MVTCWRGVHVLSLELNNIIIYIKSTGVVYTSYLWNLIILLYILSALNIVMLTCWRGVHFLSVELIL